MSLLKTVPSLLFASALGLQALLYREFPGAMGLPESLRWLALPVFLLACWVPLQAAWQFRQARTTVFAYAEPHTLVTTGIFRHTRNPMYLGMLLVLVSVALGFNRWPLWLPVLFFPVPMHWLVIRWEERTLAGKWPEAYARWCRQTPRWGIFV